MAKPRSKQASVKKGKKPAAQASPIRKRTPDRPPPVSNSPDIMSRNFRLSRDSEATGDSRDVSEDSLVTPIQSPTASQSHIRSGRRRPGPKSMQKHSFSEHDEESDYPTPETSVTEQSGLEDDGDANEFQDDEENSGTPNGDENSAVSNLDQTGKKSIQNDSRRKQAKPKKWSTNLKLALEMAELQVNTKLLMRKAPFQRVVRDIMFELSAQNYRITPTALDALQESVELYVTQYLEDSYACTLHRGQVTLAVKDMRLVEYLRRNYER